MFSTQPHVPVAVGVLACELVLGFAFVFVLDLQNHALLLMARLVLPETHLAEFQGVAEGRPGDDVHLYELWAACDMS